MLLSRARLAVPVVTVKLAAAPALTMPLTARATGFSCHRGAPTGTLPGLAGAT